MRGVTLILLVLRSSLAMGHVVQISEQEVDVPAAGILGPNLVAGQQIRTFPRKRLYVKYTRLARLRNRPSNLPWRKAQGQP